MKTAQPLDNHTAVHLRKNLIGLMRSHHIGESELSKKLNIPYNTIKRILTGITSDPRISTLEQLADFFGVTVDYFLSENPTIQHELTVPLLNWDLVTSPDFFNHLDRSEWKHWISIAPLEGIQDLQYVFALESTRSMHPRFPLGSTFVIHTQEPPIDGDVILIRFKPEQVVSLRELSIDAPNWQLNPIVSGSPSLFFNHNEHTIVGVVVLTMIQTRQHVL